VHHPESSAFFQAKTAQTLLKGNVVFNLARAGFNFNVNILTPTTTTTTTTINNNNQNNNERREFLPLSVHTRLFPSTGNA
jgi:hypothetical protein